MRAFDAALTEIERLPGGRTALSLSAPALADIACRPGQCLNFLAGEGLARDPYLPITALVTNDAGDGRLQTVVSDVEASPWLERRRGGDRISGFGPIGIGWRPPGDVRRLALVAEDAGRVPELLLMSAQCADEGLSVTLAVGGEAAPTFPTRLLHPAVEYLPAGGDLGAGPTPEHQIFGDAALRWADLYVLAGTPPFLRTSSERISYRRIGSRPSVVTVQSGAMPCGVGWCAGCLFRAGGRRRFRCLDGIIAAERGDRR